METTTVDHLTPAAGEIAMRLMRAGAHPPVVLNEVRRAMSHECLIKIFSDNWLVRNFYGELNDVPKDELSEFTYKSLVIDLPEFIRRSHRLILFAESLFNLQEIPNFSYFVKEIFNRTKSGNPRDLEASFAEILAARFLYLADVDFEFVKRTGKSGGDYDMECTIDTKVIPVEVKCKTNEGYLNFKSFMDGIDRAVAQAGRDRRKIIFVKVPEKWTFEPEFKNIQYLGLFSKTGLTIDVGNNDVCIFWEKSMSESMNRMVELQVFLSGRDLAKNPLSQYIFNPSRIHNNSKYFFFEDFAWKIIWESGKSLVEEHTKKGK